MKAQYLNTLITCFLFTLTLCAQQVNNENQQTITGQITHLESPVPDVNISIEGTKRGTKTNSEGLYSIVSKTGEVLVFSHVSYKTLKVVVEDVTHILNIELAPNVNELDETVITKRKPVGKVEEHFKKKNKKFTTSRGVIDPKRVGYAITFVDGNEISNIYSSLSQALIGKRAGLTIDPLTKKLIVKPATSINNAPPPLWDIDGQIFDEEPPLDLSNIEDIHILKTLAGTNRYGSAGAGGVIVVRTKSGTFENTDDKRNKIAERYTNKNIYNQDAININENIFSINQYSNILKEINYTEKALAFYNNTIKSQISDLGIHLSIAQNFIDIYNDKQSAQQILKDQVMVNQKHPEKLKAIAYKAQQLNLKGVAIQVYKLIYKLRPNYAQSYRDLANAYTENNQYKKAWRLYLSYLFQGYDLNDEGIGQILYNEMEYLYFNRKNQSGITQKFVPKNENIQEFRNDIRLVVEWNTSEAEFDLEFVSPDQRSYAFEHTLAANQQLITREKEIGYSSKEFIVSDIGDGEWLINLTYKGNKKPEPTFFKVTTYYHWGKSAQKQEVKVYQLDEERHKIQLMRLNKQLLLANR